MEIKEEFLKKVTTLIRKITSGTVHYLYLVGGNGNQGRVFKKSHNTYKKNNLRDCTLFIKEEFLNKSMTLLWWYFGWLGNSFYV